MAHYVGLFSTAEQENIAIYGRSIGGFRPYVSLRRRFSV